jgi:hypothetical protein
MKDMTVKDIFGGGIKLHVLDAGGKLIFDAEGNVTGKTDPLIEMEHTNKQRLLISVQIK